MKTPADIAKDLRLFAKYHLVRRVYDHPAREEELGVELIGYDPDAYTSQLKIAAGDAFAVEVVDHVAYRGTERPIHLVSTDRDGATKTLLVLGGVHGNEQAGLLAIPPLLCAIREQNLAPDVEVRIVTPVNAVGAAEASRYNADGFDINRDFVRFETREAQLVRQVFEERPPDFMVSLHEGPQPATFLFANRLVAPSKAERLLARLDGVAEAAVIGVPDERLGEVGKAFVVALPGAELDADTVIAFTREHLANFKTPRTVEFLDALPRNPGGKVVKPQLRERA